MNAPAPRMTFDEVHTPGSRVLSASKWPLLALDKDDLPSWMPSRNTYRKYLLGQKDLPKAGRPALIGQLLEDDVLDLLAEDHGIEVSNRQAQFWHHELRAVAHVDGVAGDKIVETKVTTAPLFETKYEDGPPMYVRAQVQAQMACSGHKGAIIVCCAVSTRFFADMTLHIYDEPRHEGFIARLEDEGRRFLEELRDA